MTYAKRMYLDKDNGKLAGVCAGVADFFGWRVKTVRILWVIATLIWPPILIAAYVLMAWLLEAKPRMGYRTRRTHDMQESDEPSSPRDRFVDVKSRFDRLEARLRAMEGVVTSRGFQMDRELKSSGSH